MKRALGLMSGTSCDGVSVALAGFENRRFEVFGFETYPYPKALASALKNPADLRTPGISSLNVSLGIFFADCVKKFLVKIKQHTSDITVIGSHGHTIYHAPRANPGHTLQIGDPSWLAARTGIPVVSDFRPMDIALGGQGAPLIPFFDRFFFDGPKPKALQNIGGIANVTRIGGGLKMLAFDTGPGNCLMDLAIQKITRGKKNYDAGGKLASRGRVNMKTVRKMAAHAYFKKKPPKSTGRELFNEAFIPRELFREAPENLLATLTFFTAYTLHEAYKRFAVGRVSEILVSGGGALNLTLMHHLQTLFNTVPVRPISDLGLPAQAKEPVAFAFFALEALQGRINHAPEGTGAKKSGILGKITPVYGKSKTEERTPFSSKNALSTRQGFLTGFEKIHAMA